MALLRTIDAATEPVTVAEVKTHLRLTGTSEDTYLGTLITAARYVAENELGRALIAQTWEKTLDEFPQAAIELPYPPLVSVTSISYLEAVAGATVALSSSSYVVDTKSEPGWIVPAYGYDWPSTYDTINAVTITYSAGWANAAAVPQPIKQWILVHVGHLYENRELTNSSGIPGMMVTSIPFLSGLLDPYRVPRIG